jgi:ribonuclease HI
MKRIFVDGAARGNPGPAAIAFVVEDGAERGEVIGNRTNNEAEYIAVYRALEFADRYLPDDPSPGRKDIWIVSDSKLVVNQLNGEWKIKEPRLGDVASAIRNIAAERFTSVEFSWMPRTHPSLVVADNICNDVLDGKHHPAKPIAGAWGEDVPHCILRPIGDSAGFVDEIPLKGSMAGMFPPVEECEKMDRHPYIIRATDDELIEELRSRGYVVIRGGKVM